MFNPNSPRARRRALTLRAQRRKLTANRRQHQQPPRAWRPAMGGWYGRTYICDCFWNRRFMGRARKTSPQAGFGRECRRAFVRVYWGGVRLRTRQTLRHWSVDGSEPAPSYSRRSSYWACF
jgi:hypothetical protein